MNLDPPADPYESFVRLFVAPEARLRGLLRALLPSWEDVDDVLQEASLEAMLWSDAGARRRLRERAAFAAGMRQWAESRGVEVASPWRDSTGVARASSGEPGSIHRRAPLRSAFALAACAALAFSLLSYFAGSRQTSGEEGEPSVSGCATDPRLVALYAFETVA